ncbi:hypothetical protein CALVIDRAFT_562034 [Calocera viscosa TUFC12733]|uniref:DUF7918 domain-containing protein n=1 Tax=Calocera viscosa (strain TUFC12733) TaxID=1330018 RepID=A0A167PAG5_CALVF|nr:hypothetical protein CALVIDRAFT_562034 [Calocera viscosa TUFC12733]
MPRSDEKKVELFQAWITVNGNRLPEYDPQYDPDTNTWTCWIPSEVGQRFVVHWRNFGKRATTGAYVYVDGEFADGKLLMKDNAAQSTFVNGKRTASATIARFYFQPIVLTDEENPFLLEDDNTVNSIGEMKVIINKGRNAGIAAYRHGTVKPARAVNERAKKAGAHRVQYADEVNDTDDIGAMFRPDQATMPLTFIFKYRPKDMLQAMGIIARGEAIGGFGRTSGSAGERERGLKEEPDIKRERSESPPAESSTAHRRKRTRSTVKAEE